MSNNMDWCNDCILEIDRICAKHIHACCIKVKDLKIEDELCAPLVSAPAVCAGQITGNKADLNSACVANLNAPQACVQNLTATNAGITSLIANDLCVPGTLRAANLLNCGKYRANVVYSKLTNYTLGSFINFDDILDDPNNNLTLSPTTYTVPVSGYYTTSMQFNSQNLIPLPAFGPILGVLVANPQLYVNGLLVRELFLPFLSFNPQQKTSLSSILQLKAGDLVQMKYNVVAIDAASGVVSVPGSVDSIGDGTDNNTSGFKIHMLSVDCPSMPCAPSQSCAPCSPMQCVPCVPCMPVNPPGGDCGCEDKVMANVSMDADKAAKLAKMNKS